MNNINCPKCNQEIAFDIRACHPKEQIVYLSVDSQNGYLLDAKPIGELLINATELFRISSEYQGAKVDVFIHSIEYAEGKFTVGLLIAEIKDKK